MWMLPATTLANHNKYFIIVVFDSTNHNNTVSLCTRSNHHTCWPVANCQVNDLQVKSCVLLLNVKSSKLVTRFSPYDLSQQVWCNDMNSNKRVNHIIIVVVMIYSSFLPTSQVYQDNIYWESSNRNSCWIQCSWSLTLKHTLIVKLT